MFLTNNIREMLQKADLTEHRVCKDYAVKQARVIKNNNIGTEPAACGPALDAALKDSTAGTAKDAGPVYTPQEEEEWHMMIAKGGVRAIKEHGKGEGQRGRREEGGGGASKSDGRKVGCRGAAPEIEDCDVSRDCYAWETT